MLNGGLFATVPFSHNTSHADVMEESQVMRYIYGVIRSARDTEDFFFSQLLSVPWVLTRCQPWQRCEEQRACWTHSVG